MRYQFKGMAGRWNVYDEAGERIGSVRRSMGRRMEYRYGDNRQAFDIRRKGNAIWLEQGGKIVFSGEIRYPVDGNGKPVTKSLFCPPMPEELRMEQTEGAGELHGLPEQVRESGVPHGLPEQVRESWTLHQLPNRNIEIYFDGTQVGILRGLIVGTKTLDWSGDEELLERGLLCFVLGVYMAEDDTVYAV